MARGIVLLKNNRAVPLVEGPDQRNDFPGILLAIDTPEFFGPDE
jgi:hypothetical protein